jgi:hypothetical protein
MGNEGDLHLGNEEMGGLSFRPEEQPTVSVVIPLYNKGKYVERALTSVLAQTFSPLEIIVVDDGSSDDGPEKVLKFSSPKITLIRQENRGPGAARNAGLAIAKGKYIAFLDADDEWMPSFLERGLSMIESEAIGTSAVWTGFLICPDMKKNNEEMEDLRGVYEVGIDTDIGLILQIVTFSFTSATIVKAEVARKLGGFFDCYKCLRGEDTYFFIKLIFNERIGIIPEPHVIYHTEASQLYGCGFKTVPPLQPHFADATDMLASCPPAKRGVLMDYLAVMALIGARSYSTLGQRKIAMELLDRFCRNGNIDSKQLLKARLLAWMAPVLPPVHRLWRLAKSVGRMQRNIPAL